MIRKVRVAVLISGRGSNMQALVRAAEDSNFPAEIVLVLSNKADAPGLEFARSKGIKTVVIEHKNFSGAKNPREEFDKAVSEEIEKNNCDIICLAGFMRLLSSWFTSKWKNRLINIHPSLLPEFKGANAVEDALKAGALYSGCTVHFVTEEMDAGPIIKQIKVPVLKGDNIDSLAARILEKEHIIYPAALKEVCEKILNQKQ